ncbi:hypothetical protein AX16_003970 [Volvariella volvacea WC 439]|nr:hypothetical protein AX16_003970 [Volvariella volvacea WC 439]
MSGKAPPTGPRALLGGIRATSPVVPAPLHSAQALSQHQQPQLQPQLLSQRPQLSSPATPFNRIGATPPTGPRSLTNGLHARPPPPAPKNLLNGHPTPPAGPSALTGLRPSSPQSRHQVKGKKPDSTTPWPASSGWQSASQVNGHSEVNANGVNGTGNLGANGSRSAVSIPIGPSSTRTTLNGLPSHKPSISIPLQPRSAAKPPQPTDPPPPAPSYEPPPPPPSQPPPPAPPPPPEPTSVPPPPPKTEPPPTPPSMPPPPPPPSSPPPPPPDLVIVPPPPPPIRRASSPSHLKLSLTTDNSLPSPHQPTPSMGATPTFMQPPPSPPIQPPPPKEEPPALPPADERLRLPPKPQTFDPRSRSITPSQPSMSISLPPPPPSLPPMIQKAAPSAPEKAIENAAPAPPKLEPAPARSPSPEPPKLYSVPEPPVWPPPRSEYPPVRSFKVLYDPSDTNITPTPLNPHGPPYYRALIEHVRKHATPAVAQERIRGKVKGREALFRFEGEVVGAGLNDEGVEFAEEEIVVKDPRKNKAFKRPHCIRPFRSEFYRIGYEYDANSTGPPPPTAVLITNITPLTPNQQIRRHFSNYGTIVGFEPQIDKENGSALGIVHIKFSTHEEAKRCVERESNRKGGILGTIAGKGEDDMRVVMDGEGLKLKAVLKELDERKRRDREEKKRRDAKLLPNGNTSASGSASAGGKSTPTPQTPLGQTPNSTHWKSQPQTAQPPRAPSSLPYHSSRLPPHSSLPANPITGRPPHPLPPNPSLHLQQQPPIPPQNNDRPPSPKPQNRSLPPRPPPSLVKARLTASVAVPMREPSSHMRGSSSSTPLQPSSSRGRPPYLSRAMHYDHYQPSPAPHSRSPSPPPTRWRESHKSRDMDRDEVVDELVKNGNDHVKIGQLRGGVREEDVKTFFSEFPVDKVLKDHTGWYVTFQNATSARRAAMVINNGSKMLAYQTVTLAVHPPPPARSATLSKTKTKWEPEEMIEQAQDTILKELRGLLQKDLVERVVGPEYRKLVAEIRSMKEQMGQGQSVAVAEPKPVEKKGLKGLSFKKQPKKVVEEVKEVAEVVQEAASPLIKVDILPPEEEDDETGSTTGAVAFVAQDLEAERPTKRRKKEAATAKKVKKAVEEREEVESEEDDFAKFAQSDAVRKRGVAEEVEGEEPEKEPARKKQRLDGVKKVAKRKSTKKLVEEEETVVMQDDLGVNAPVVTQLKVQGRESPPLLPSRSSSPELKPPRVVTPPPTPPPDPLQPELCEDDEDMYFAKLVLMGYDPSKVEEQEEPSKVETAAEPDPDSPTALPPFRKHATGSARTEGFYKITHAEKAAYVAQYQARSTNVKTQAVVEEPQQPVVSSRSNRANARRRALGLEEINQVQRAVALSKGEAANDLTFKFNQLQTRKKHLKFARSPIHDWGLYAMEKISKGEMVIEYVGEIVRAAVADKREKAYERQGIGSSYLFRIDEDLVVDATKKGNLGRLINHSCDPNCTAKIITINGEKKIVIYAKQDIDLGDEITYDYHFPFEQDKIPCLCGSAKCRGFLN